LEFDKNGIRKGGFMRNIIQSNEAEITGGKEIDLKELFFVIKKRLWVLVIITLLMTSLGIIKNTLFSSPLYQSSTRIIIGANEDYMNTLQVLIKDSTVLDKVVKELDINRSAEGLAGQITVASVNDSKVVNISVVDSDPKLAAEIANTTAKIYKSEIPKIVGFSDVKLLKEANINPYPINSNQNRTIILFLVVGLVLGTGAIFFLDSLDDSIKSNRDVERILGLSILGTVPKMNKRHTKKKNIKQIDIENRGETIGIQ
jgi:capsular polysaccharide biosynthesis protein